MQIPGAFLRDRITDQLYFRITAALCGKRRRHTERQHQQCTALHLLSLPFAVAVLWLMLWKYSMIYRRTAGGYARNSASDGTRYFMFSSNRPGFKAWMMWGGIAPGRSALRSSLYSSRSSVRPASSRRWNSFS